MEQTQEQAQDQAQPGWLKDQDARKNVSLAVEHAPAAGRGEQPTPQSPLIGSDPPQEIQDALKELVRGYELESDVVRRHKVRQWREAEEFWRGNQNIWWNEREGRWHTPFDKPDGVQDDPPRYDYSFNYYRAWGLSTIAALTQSPAKVTYLPVSAESEDDVATAKAATKIVELVAMNNDMDQLRTKKAYYLWNQGIYAAYVRFVVDGGLYGYETELPDVETEIELMAARWTCQNCGAESPATEQPGQEIQPKACDGCGQMMGPESFSPSEKVNVPVQGAPRRVPKGAEKIDVFGPLFVKVPPQAQDQRSCYYLIMVEEQHKATLRAAYPDKAAKIGDELAAGAEDTYERIVRLSLADAQGTWNSLPMSSLVTYKRAWLRPEAFWAHADDKIRAKLLDLYPDGVLVEFAGTQFLHARPERLDDHWVVGLGLPGIGIYRDGIGHDAISVQREINDNANILAEHREMASAPPILYNAAYINGDAMARKRMEPASYVPVVFEAAGAQKPMSELLFQPRFGVDPALWTDGDRLAEMGQFITGALPTIFGGGSPNLKTAAAYSQAREQAMGRLALIWKNERAAEAKTMTLAVECFKRNRLDDAELVSQSKGGGFKSDYIRLGEVRGNAVARPSADEDFPQTWGQVRDTIMQLLQTKDEDILSVLGAPVNREVLKHYLGLPELEDPTGDNRAKQFRENDALLQSAPLEGPNGQPVPTVMPELRIDDHATHIEVVKDWAVSQIGLECKVQNPRGYANVLAHLLAHIDCQQRLAADQGVRQQEVKNSVQAAATPEQPEPQQPGAAPEAQGTPPAQITQSPPLVQ